MGRTTPTARQYADRITEPLMKMASMMNSSDREILESLIRSGRKRSAEISYSMIQPEFGFLFSIILDLQKEINALRQRCDGV